MYSLADRIAVRDIAVPRSQTSYSTFPGCPMRLVLWSKNLDIPAKNKNASTKGKIWFLLDDKW